ncbi:MULTISPECIES: YlqD family protein [Okeania]|uniref:YlqD protein n=1 Tax=Okeania hirsuta TaxID=1458930 RepID=A0A3N6PNA8_9CYAN|nr:MULTISPECIES: YlqD family protein [Okeania]NEP06871.1 hypothetical protein [Okeania sp. SIO4D6]NEP39528.1 hypothetical protein [Okeania sp. SIO2H7]NET12190.1 hypothetical protein [Okeania sp. SIO1H6]NEP73773.1 hypothetical protein [Okeania sp. SIO2G5]NEP90729.1 hypothetical protein [Okeania sp. SIO2C2]
MEYSQTQLLLKRAINVRVVVTPRWKEEAQQQLQTQINNLDSQLQQIEIQGQKAIAEIRKQSVQPPGPQVQQQINNIQAQIGQKKNEFVEQKNQALQQLQQVQTLELEQEVSQGQIESVFTADVGDNLIKKMQVEVLLRDGVIEEVRGEV